LKLLSSFSSDLIILLARRKPKRDVFQQQRATEKAKQASYTTSTYTNPILVPILGSSSSSSSILGGGRAFGFFQRKEFLISGCFSKREPAAASESDLFPPPISTMMELYIRNGFIAFILLLPQAVSHL
jgi:hypothetical protein